ncbi:HEPN domain-containing protein [Parapedobacter deserti]
MDLDRIFLFSYPTLDSEQQHLLLVVNPVKGLAPKALAPIVSLCFSDTEAIPFDMIITGEWQNQLKHGSLYYTYASLPQHELYADPKKKSPLFSRKVISSLLELSALNYAKCRKNSDEFRKGVDNYLIKGEYGQATFMLHQFLELRLKGLMATIGMNGGKSHNIEHLMKSVRSFVPQLTTLFPYDDSHSVDLLRLLDQSYVKAKKQESVDISLDEFNILLDKCEQAKFTMDEMVATMTERIHAYREQLPKEAEKQPDTNPTQQATGASAAPTASTQLTCEDFSGFPWPEQYKKDVNALLDRIHQTHRPEQVMMLNYHTGGFSGVSPFQQEQAEEREGSKTELYLVVLMKNKGPFHFKCMEVGEVSAMVVYLSVDQVRKKLAEGNRFVYTLWTRGQVLRKKSTFSPAFTLAEPDWMTERKAVVELWENAKACMGNLIGVIQNASVLKIDTGLLLLRNLLEIGVNTYLRCAVGYVPKTASLAELIDWSGITDRRLLDFIYPTSKTDKVRLHLVLWPEMIWWKNVEIGLSKVSQSFYRDKAKEIFSFFENLCADVRAEMESKVEKAKDPEQEVSV